MEKTRLRNRMKQIRAAIPCEMRVAEETKIRENLLQSDLFHNAQELFCYVSLKEEADTVKIIECAFANKKKVAVPKVLTKTDMEFYYIDSLTELSKGRWGILEPVTNRKAELKKGSLMLLPGLAFDSNGTRLGYGGGFYDRYLSKNNGLAVTCGISYREQLIDHVPGEEFDLPVDYIISPSGIIKGGEKI